MILTIDIGNTYIKFKAWQAGVPVHSGRFLEDELEKLPGLVSGGELQGILFASVGSMVAEDKIAALFPGTRCQKIISAKEFCGVTNGYEEPSRLGVDRWLAIIEAYYHSGKKSCLVLDLGTALTLDVIDSAGMHMGGYIVPGLRMMRDALQLSTQQVRFAAGKGLRLGYGVNTAEAVENGTFSMIVAWLNSEVDEFLRRFPDGTVYLTGGMSSAIKGCIRHSVIHHEDLVLDALYRMGSS